MGKRGRRRIPTLLKELHGNPGKRALPIDEPQGVGALWDPPVWFDNEQREQWRHALDRAPPGLLTGTDRAIFTGWCVAVVEYAKAVVEVRTLSGWPCEVSLRPKILRISGNSQQPDRDMQRRLDMADKGDGLRTPQYWQDRAKEARTLTYLVRD
jgi:hypothetical protein